MCIRGLVIEGENPCHAALLHHMLTLANPFLFEMAPDCNLVGPRFKLQRSGTRAWLIFPVLADFLDALWLWIYSVQYTVHRHVPPDHTHR